MKKILLSALVLGFATVTTVNAAPVTKNTVITVVNDQEETPVKAEDLPAPVKATLAGEEYKEWQVVTAHKMIKDGLEVYKINVQKGEETKTLKLDKEGNVMKEKAKES